MATSLNLWDYTVDVCDPVIADHSAVLRSVNLDTVSSIATFLPWSANYDFKYRPIKEQTLFAFNETLTNICWEDVVGCDGDPSVSLESFFNTFLRTFDCFFRRRPVGLRLRGTKPQVNLNTMSNLRMIKPGTLLGST